VHSLIYNAPDGSLSLYALVWLPGQWTPVHDHGSWGVVGVAEGVLEERSYVRLTADGQFRTCLFATNEFDLRVMLRNGADDDAIAAEIQRAVGTKWAGHNIGNVTFVRPRRSMSQIGG
jgi:molybdenum cofactor biosynthesis enzyme MoaA